MNAYQLDGMLTDYKWMITTIKEMKKELDVIVAGTAQYGIEAAMPKGNSVGNTVHAEMLRREKHIKRIVKYEEKIRTVQELVDVIQADREAEVLFWILEGRSMRWIGRHMGLSHTSIQNIRTGIIDSMISQDVDK
ncbi:hypothetical protein ABE042_15700 [Viridibacillus arvi]|uniref:helix-turn-helix transcriptional regulator n=1 Tax=Viridibacillus arvi TaxID=263475 RepID=UPI003D282EA6